MGKCRVVCVRRIFFKEIKRAKKVADAIFATATQKVTGGSNIL